MTRPFLPYARQLIEDDDVAAVTGVMRGDFLTTGPEVERFEAALCDVTGARHAIACATGTAALHLAGIGLELTPGDAVIVPAVTFTATASSVRLCGADVVFADVDPDSGRIRPEDVEAAKARLQGRRLKAVYGVDLGGWACDRQSLAEAAGEGVALLMDACHALGGDAPNGGRVGDAETAQCETFSFHPVKTVAMGEGGALTTNDADIAARARMMRNHGLTREPNTWREKDLAYDADGTPNTWYYELHAASTNYRVTDMQCALGTNQLGKLPRFAAARAAVRAVYDAELPRLSPVVRAVTPSAVTAPVLHLYIALIDFAAVGLSRRQVMERLRAEGIGTQVHYIPLHLQPYFRDLYGASSLPGAESYYARALSLPMFAGMSPDDARRVVDTLEKVLAGAG